MVAISSGEKRNETGVKHWLFFRAGITNPFNLRLRERSAFSLTPLLPAKKPTLLRECFVLGFEAVDFSDQIILVHLGTEKLFLSLGFNSLD